MSVWLLIALTLLLGLELFSRFYLGLGNPPLTQTHPRIEYMFKPNQSVHRFGNLFKTNRYGMRSDDFPPTKSSANEIRVMVYGDSVINGGSLTDHSRLATTLIQHALSERFRRSVIVGNISAGSWGPPNQLAYIQQYGFLDADIAVFVLSSSDYDDAPTFEPLDPSTHPWEKPSFALMEALTVYAPRLLDQLSPPKPPPADLETNPQDVKVSLGAVHDFLTMARAEGVTPIVVQHWESGELVGNNLKPGHDAILHVAKGLAVLVFQDADVMRRSQNLGQNPYRDVIHPNDKGQAALADLLTGVLTPLIEKKIAVTPQ